ncbi:Protein-tyrosine sulfotransferase A [Schistosoma japonicum]|nr:Protein-tyrosine sulfotransferase A [Schistosoma japonicum]
MKKYSLRKCYGQFRMFVFVIGSLSILLMGLSIFNKLNTIKYQSKHLNKMQRNTKHYNLRDSPFIFIGGHQSTGTGLMRIILDIHPLVRCGPEPIVTREILRYRRHQDSMIDTLSKVGITYDVLDDATAAFIATVIQKMGPYAERLCHKDPSSYLYLEELADIFPKAKFIHMIRDGRAAIASTISRGIHPLYVPENVHTAIAIWERTTSQMLSDCENIGSVRCLTVRYEYFLELPWDDKLLEHEKFVQNTSMLNKYEASSPQIVKSIYKKSLNAWSDDESHFPMDFILFMNENSTLLKTLGYVTDEIPPNYENLCNS